MAKTDFKSADEYIGTFPPEKQAILREVRAAIRKAVPEAEEVISYQIPAFKSGKGWIFYYSMFSGHYSLACPPPFAAFKEFADRLAQYKQSKSAVNFPLDRPVPAKLITQMAQFQARSLAAATAEKDKAKAKGPAADKAKPKAKPKAVAKAKAGTGSKSNPKAKAKAAKRK